MKHKRMNFYKKLKLLFFIGLLSTQSQISAQNVLQRVNSKIKTLENLVKKAENRNLEITKEKSTLNTATLFLKYAK
ncbi:hypothetical protein [Aquimarina sp. RZ0]|uniref:hypothetical protein n=1 Tax=Aquimarina sp. RZ0 TaxID=2607730 RepID=UPI0011F2B3A7|nr:hypothetical protein [Aquimarina sp. RZ0]KAA1247484.1 hypothetical protein F0000_03220 [Aquimarina sp. RZ0]